MALPNGVLGQAGKYPLTIQFTNASGVPTDPSANSFEIWLVNADGSLSSKATGSLTKQASKDGFYGVFLDISDRSTWPAGEYVVRWEATISGTTTATTESFHILAAASVAGSNPLTNAYCSDAEVRAWARSLEAVAAAPAQLVADMAARGAEMINGRLGQHYSVPFSSPYPALIVQANVMIAAGRVLTNRSGQQGNLSTLGAQFLQDADDLLERIQNGDAWIGVQRLETNPEGDTHRYQSSEGTKDPIMAAPQDKADTQHYSDRLERF